MVQDTIFSPSFGNRPQRLIGREDVIRQFLYGLHTTPGSRERMSLILGQRGTGKTVLLLELAELARKNDYIVASPTIVNSNMLERIVEKLQDEGERLLHEKDARIAGASLGALGFSVGLQFTRDIQESKTFSYKLAKLTKVLNEQGKGVLILIDEVQASNAGLKELIIAYQELVGERANIAVVLAGLPAAIASTLNDKVLTFLNRANRIILQPLAAVDIDSYYKQSFDELGITLHVDQREKAVEATDGSPYLMQLIGHCITQYADSNGELDNESLYSSIRMAQRTFQEDVCQTSLHGLSDMDLEFLRAMLPGDGPAKIADIRERLKVKADYAQRYKSRLMEAGIIESARRGEVQFAVPLLAEYMLSSMNPIRD